MKESKLERRRNPQKHPRKIRKMNTTSELPNVMIMFGMGKCLPMVVDPHGPPDQGWAISRIFPIPTSLMMMTSLSSGMSGLRLRRAKVLWHLGMTGTCMTSTKVKSLLQQPWMNQGTLSQSNDLLKVSIHFHVCHALINIQVIVRNLVWIMMVSTSTSCSILQWLDQWLEKRWWKTKTLGKPWERNG